MKSPTLDVRILFFILFFEISSSFLFLHRCFSKAFFYDFKSEHRIVNEMSHTFTVGG